MLRSDSFTSPCKFRRRHFRKIAEAAHDGVQVRQLAFNVAVDSSKISMNCFGSSCLRALQVFHRDLQRKQRIAQLMRQPPRQFAPRGYAFGLQQSIFLHAQRARHIVERDR